jgi:PAS domain S-box-containing protein
MPRPGKHDERTQQVPRGKKKPAKVEPLHLQTEDALWHSRYLLKSIADGTSDAIYVKDLQGRYLLFNAGASQATGKSEQEVLGHDDTALFPADEAKIVMEGDRKVMESAKTTTYEEVVTTPDGVRTYQSTKGPIFDQAGRVSGLFGIARDITERKRAEEELSASETRFRTLFENVIDGLLLADLETMKFHVANPQISRMLGYSADELKTMAIPDIHPAEVLPQVIKAVAAQAKGDSQTATEIPVRRKDGSIFYADISSKPLWMDGRQYLLGIFHDATERRKMSEIILKEQKRSLNLINSSIDGIHAFDLQCRYFIWNPAMERISGKKKDEVLGRCAFDVFPFIKETGGDKYFYEALSGKNIVAKDRPYVIPETGKKGFFEGHYAPLHDEQNNIIGGLAIVRDTTESKLAEESLRESEDKFKYVFDNSVVGKTITLTTGQMQPNKALCEMLGYSLEELKAKKWQDITHPDDVEVNQKSIGSLLLGQENSVQFSKRYIHKDGSVIWADVSTSLRRDKAGKPLYFMATIIDITERKRVEEELEKLASVVRYSRELVNIATFEGQMIFINEAGAAMLGIDSKQVNKHFIFEVIPEHLQVKVREEVLPKTLKEGVWEGDLQYINLRTGRLTDVHAMTFIIRNPVTQNPLYIANVSLDITEQKQAQEALRESEEKYRTVIETTDTGFVALDEQGRVSNANLNYARMVGYSSVNEIIGRNVTEWTAPYDIERNRTEIDKCFKNGVVKNLVVDYKRTDETIFPVEINANVVQTKKGKTILTLCRDITERKQVEDAKFEALARFSGFAEASQYGMGMADLEGRIVYVNSTLVDMLGEKSANDCLGKHFPTAYYPQSMTRRLQKEIMPVLIRDGHWHGELELHTADGRCVPTDENYFVIRDEHGQPRYLADILTDITERKRAQKALQESEERYRKITKCVPDLIWTTDLSDKITYINSAVERNYGWTVEECLKLSSGSLSTPQQYAKDRAMTEEELAKAANPQYDRNTTYTFESEELRKDGSTFWAEVSASFLWSDDGKPVGIIGTTRDITERKKAEEQINLLKHSIDIHFDGAYWFDSNNKLIYVNDAGCRALGYQREELLGKTLSEVSPKATEKHIQELWEQLRSKKKFTTESVHRRKDGSEFPVEISSTYIQFGGKEYCCGFARDITERKQIQEALQLSGTRFREMFNRMSSGVAVYEAVDDGTDFVFKDFNAAGQRLEKNRLENIIGRRVTEVFPGVREMGLLDVFRRVWKTGKPENQPMTLYKDNRLAAWRENYVYKLPSGEVVAVYDDVTERQAALEQLKEERNLLRTLIDHIPDGIYVKDSNSRFILYNKAVAEHWCPKDQTSLLGKTDFDILPLATAQFYFDEERKIMNTNQPLVDREGTRADNNGKLHHFLTTKVPLRDTHGNIAGTVGINHDITAIKIFESKLLDYQKQLKRLASRLITVEEQERRRIATDIHDEISQTLAMAKIKLDKLRNSPLPDTTAQVIGEVTRFVEQVIQETRTLTFELSNPILYELGFEIAVAEWLSENVGEKHGIATEFKDDGQPKPMGDDLKAMLFRNTRELLTNCIKHANAGNIEVIICRIDDIIQISVEDNGAGFDPAQLKTTGKKPKFGLFSIRENLENMGGRLEIDSKPGAGCRAIMTAPIENQNNNKEV